MDHIRIAILAMLLACAANASYFGQVKLWDGTTPADVLPDSSIKARAYGLINDSTAVALRIDASSYSLQTIDYAHHEIHAGDAFFAFKDTTINSGDSLVLLIRVPNTAKWPHFGFEVISTGEAEYSLFEGVTTTDTGTTLTVFNRHRNSATAATTKMWYTPTATGGTRIDYTRWGVGKTVGGERGTGDEKVLKQNTDYRLRVISRAASNVITVRLSWYEHTNGN